MSLPVSTTFVSDPNAEDDEEAQGLAPLPAGTKNYITPQGFARLQQELLTLIDEERPKVVDIVHWADRKSTRLNSSH